MARKVLEGADLVARHRRHHRACRHEWQLISDEVDEFGGVRLFECHKCGHVHFT
ncbi:hypothetical protein [Nocardioides massiliensis]|uniref:Uncharacterized protein n=1 Tax=Nocardioides massiliensis TaxID=1325935 RepID=A0ABT9NJQ8_9ACTN|nr:hypothetical protein [Nocardioides massiliensis]MDP9820641.1 hypothetical protein [Nocardioides massiliensis]